MRDMMQKIVVLARLGAERVWESLKVLWKTTGAYLAVSVLCVGAFIVGHSEASFGKKIIRDRMRTAEAKAAALVVERDMASLEARRLAARVAELEKAAASVAEQKPRKR